jgi:hypothetical protein
MDKRFLIFGFFIFVTIVSVVGWFAYFSQEKEQVQSQQQGGQQGFPQLDFQIVAQTPGVQIIDINAKDPKQGTDGDIKISLDTNSTPPVISWPVQYALKSLKVYDLGRQNIIGDNMLIWEVIPSFTKNIQTLPSDIDGRSLLIFSPIVFGELTPKSFGAQLPIFNIFAQQNQKRYVIEAVVYDPDNSQEEKQGTYGFTY